MHRALLFGLVLCVAVVAGAEEIWWTCSYAKEGIQVEFDKSGKPVVSNGGSEGMGPIVLKMDTETGDSHLVAGKTVEVVPLLSGPTLSFVEDTPSGPNIITLFIGSPINEKEDVVFVQARHLDLNGPFPQQYYGTCKVVQ